MPAASPCSTLNTPLAASATPFPYTTLFRSDDAAADLARSNTATTAKLEGAFDKARGLLQQVATASHARGDVRGVASALNRSEEHTSELQSQSNLVCRLLLEKKNLPCSKAAP